VTLPLAITAAQPVFLRAHILELVDALKEREMLPAIFFRQSQRGCEVSCGMHKAYCIGLSCSATVAALTLLPLHLPPHTRLPPIFPPASGSR
jgi:hypothetical protein